MSEHEIIILLRNPQQQPKADIIAATRAFIAALFPAAARGLHPRGAPGRARSSGVALVGGFFQVTDHASDAVGQFL